MVIPTNDKNDLQSDQLQEAAFDPVPAFDPALPEYNLAARVGRILYGESYSTLLERVRNLCRALDEHQQNQRGRFEMLSDEGAHRVCAASQLILDCVEVALIENMLLGIEGKGAWAIEANNLDAAGQGRAYHQLNSLAEGKRTEVSR